MFAAGFVGVSFNVRLCFCSLEISIVDGMLDFAQLAHGPEEIGWYTLQLMLF